MPVIYLKGNAFRLLRVTHLETRHLEMLVVKHHSSCRKVRFGGLGYQWLPELVTTKVLKVIVVSNDGEHAETLDCHLTLVSEQTRPRIKDFLKRSSEYHNFLELTLKKK